MVRKVLIIGGSVVLVCGLLIYGILADLILGSARDAAVQAVLRSVSNGLQGSLEVGSLRGSLLSAPVLQDIVLKDAQGTEIGQIDALRLSYDLLSLLRLRLVVHTIEIVQPRFTLTEQPDGALNVSRALASAQPAEPREARKPSSGSGLPVAIVVEDIRLRDGEMAVRLAALPGVRQVTGLQVRLQAQLDQQGVQVRWQHMRAHTAPAGVDIHTLQGAFHAAAGMMRVDGLRLEVGQTVLTANGVLPHRQQPADFSLHMDPLDVAEIGRLIQQESLRGGVRLALQVEGPPEALVTSLDLSPTGEDAQGSLALRGEVNMSATPLRYRARLDIDHLDLTAVLNNPAWQSDVNLQTEVEGSGIASHELHSDVRIDIHPSHVGDITLQGSQIHLQAQEGRFQVRHFDVETSMARLTATGSVDLAGKSDLHYEVTAALHRLRRLLDEPLLDGDVHLQGEASGEWPNLTMRGGMDMRHVRYRDYALEALQLTYEGAGLGAQPTASAELRLQRAQLGTIPVEQVNVTATYDGTARQFGFSVAAEQSRDYGMHTQGTVTLQDTGQQVHVDALRVQLADRIWHTAAPLQVIHAGDRLQLTPLRLVHAEESIEISGGLVGDQVQEIRVQASQIDLAIMQRLMALPDPMHGRAHLDVRLSGTLPAPLLDVDLRLQPEGGKALPFQDVQASLAYAQRLLQGQVRVRQTDREVFAVDLRLPIDMALTAMPTDRRLIEGPIALDVHLRQPNLSALAGWLPGVPPLSGTMQGTIGVQGTAAQLALDAEVRLQKLGVEGTVEHVESTMSLTGRMVAAPSIQELQQAIQRGDLTLRADELALRIPTLQGRLHTREGTVQPFEVRDFGLQADGRWSPSGLAATLQSLRMQAQAFGLPRTELVLEAGVTPERIDLKRLHVRLPRSELRGYGNLTVADQVMQFQIEIPRLQLDEFPITLPPDLPRQLQGVIAVNGSLQAPRVEARLNYAGARIGADLAAQLQESVPRYQAMLRVETLDIARLLPNLAGQIDTTLQLQGAGFTEEQRQATVDLAVDTRNFGLAPGLTVRLHSTLAGKTLDLERLRVSSTPVQLTANGVLSAAPGSGLNYTLTLGDLAPLRQVLGAELQANGTLTGKVQGPLDDLQTMGTLRLQRWRFADISGQTLAADFAASQLPAAPQGSVRMQISDIQAPSLPPTSVQLDANYAPSQGQITATVTKGPYEKTTLAGRIALNDGQQIILDRLRVHHQDLAWENDGPVEVVRQAQGDLSLQRFALRSGAQRLSVTGRLAHDGPLAADVVVQQLQIGPHVRVVMPEGAVPEGQLDLTLRLEGTIQQPQGQGNLRLSSLSWQDRALGEISMAIELAGQRLGTDVRWRARGRELLQVQGTAALSPDGPLAMHVQAPGLDLEMLKGLVPQVVHSAGLLRLDLQASGTLQQPRLDGSLLLDQGAVQLAVTGERYQDIQMRIVFAGDRIDIQQLQVGSRSGPLEVVGWVQLAGLALQQLDMTIRAREFTAMHTPGIQALVNMDLGIRGSLQEMNATGTVTVPRLRVQLNQVPGTGPKSVQPWELTVQGVYGPGPEAVAAGENGAVKALRVEGPLPFLRADIRVDMPRNAWVQGPGTAIEMSGDMRITKELEQPFILNGGISIDRGFASVFGKRFVMKEGRVTFTGSPEINPLLDIAVTHTVSNYLVEIRVGGKATTPEISFSSIPELQQSDILSLLIVGKTMDRLTTSEQEGLSSQLGGAAGSVVAGQLQGVIGGALGLDTLTIGAGESFGSGSVSIGQYVTQDIFLSYEVGLGKSTGNRVGVEYSINPRLKLKGSTSDNGTSAVDFLWRLDY
jgi:autotransporter translocation and assembly factor TamB